MMKLKGLYLFTLFLLYVVSMQPWFMWHFSYSAVYALGALMSIGFAVANKDSMLWKKNDLRLFIVLFLGLLWFSIRAHVGEVLGNLFLGITFYVFLGTPSSFKLEILDYIRKKFAFLLLVSLAFYFIYVIGVPLPSFYSDYGEYGVDNYVFFVLTHNNMDPFNRFRCIFGEPGFMTLGIIPLFFVGKFNLRDKNNLILLLAELVSFSLAGYAVLIIITLYNCLRTGENKKIARWFIVTLLSFVTLFAVKNKDFFDIIDTNILTRVAFNDNTGTIAGYNRSTEYMDYLFEKFKKTPDIIYGIGAVDMEKLRKTTGMDDGGGNAGFKIFTYIYGIIGVVLFVFYYFLNFHFYHSRDAFVYFICLLLLLFQNSYVTWYCVLVGSYLCFYGLGKIVRN